MDFDRDFQNGSYTMNGVTAKSNENSELSSSSQALFLVHSQFIFTPIYCLLFLVGLAGNALVILVVFRDRTMRNFTNIYLVNLSTADLLILLTCMPTALADLFSQEIWIFGKTMCKAVPFLQSSVTQTSVLTILAISFERYYAICHPLKVKRYAGTSVSRTLKFLILIWALSLSMSTPYVYMTQYLLATHQNGKTVPVCVTSLQERWEQNFFLSSVTLFYLLPLMILVVLYAKIVRVLTLSRNIGNTVARLTRKADRKTFRQTGQTIHGAKGSSSTSSVFIPSSKLPYEFQGGSMSNGIVASQKRSWLRPKSQKLNTCASSKKLKLVDAVGPKCGKSKANKRISLSEHCTLPLIIDSTMNNPNHGCDICNPIIDNLSRRCVPLEITAQDSSSTIRYIDSVSQKEGSDVNKPYNELRVPGNTSSQYTISTLYKPKSVFCQYCGSEKGNINVKNGVQSPKTDKNLQLKNRNVNFSSLFKNQARLKDITKLSLRQSMIEEESPYNVASTISVQHLTKNPFGNVDAYNKTSKKTTSKLSRGRDRFRNVSRYVKRAAPSQLLPPNSGIPSSRSRCHSTSKHSAINKGRTQLVGMLIAVVFMYFVCLLPFHCLSIWLTFAPHTRVISLGIKTYTNILCFTRVMYYLNSAINPILYNVISTKFRHAFSRALGCGKKRSRRATFRATMIGERSKYLSEIQSSQYVGGTLRYN